MDEHGGRLAARLNGLSPQVRRTPPSRIAGIVDGSMTVSRDPDGSVSLHMAIGATGPQVGESDLLECILGAEDCAELCKTLSRGTDGAATPAAPIPVLIGFRRAPDTSRR